jgi:hypothetical protein
METTKELYKQKMAAQLAEWSAKLDVLNARADKATAEAKIDILAQTSKLEALKKSAQEQLDKVHASAADTWDTVKTDVGTRWDKLSGEIEAIWEKLQA